MSHEVESMMFVGETPWHRLGTRVINIPTANEAIIAAGLNWKTEFKTQVDLDLTLDNYGNHDVLTKHVNLRWNLELEVRQYGIKSFIVTVPEQTLDILLNIWGEDEEDTEKEITIEVRDVVVVNDSDLNNLIPHTLVFYKNKWKLVF